MEWFSSERDRWCPGRESNPHVPLRTRDFKSRASANFATRAGALSALYRTCGTDLFRVGKGCVLTVSHGNPDPAFGKERWHPGGCPEDVSPQFIWILTRLRSRCPSQKPPATPALFTSDEFYLSLPEVSGCGPDARHSASLLALLLRIMRLMNATIPSTSKT